MKWIDKHIRICVHNAISDLGIDRAETYYRNILKNNTFELNTGAKNIAEGCLKYLETLR